MAAVTFWVAGFDTIYACQDVEFDCSNKLHSLPAKLGISRALRLSQFFHSISLMLLTVIGMKLNFGATYLLGMIPIGLMFIYQHSLVKEGDLSQLNRAFFTVNGYVALYPTFGGSCCFIEPKASLPQFVCDKNRTPKGYALLFDSNLFQVRHLS